jgi:hypothetical protein
VPSARVRLPPLQRTRPNPALTRETSCPRLHARNQSGSSSRGKLLSCHAPSLPVRPPDEHHTTRWHSANGRPRSVGGRSRAPCARPDKRRPRAAHMHGPYRSTLCARDCSLRRTASRRSSRVGARWSHRSRACARRAVPDQWNAGCATRGWARRGSGLIRIRLGRARRVHCGAAVSSAWPPTGTPSGSLRR